MQDSAEKRPESTLRLCVNMIVRNEAAIIERALASVASVAECMVICDTGSSDGTPEVIEGFCRGRGIPLELHRFPFVDFSQARNEALTRARASAFVFDYLLLLDADMQLVVEGGQWLEALNCDAAQLMQQSGSLAYANVRMLRRDAAARYVGATHEVLVVEGSSQRLDGAHFIDHADGANRPEKLARDERLLRGALANDPADTRAMYYLAQTLRDAGRHAESAEWYERRVVAGGWEEERWHACYRAAQERLAAGHEVAFVAGCLDAYAMRPHRAEPLASLARHYAGKQRHDAALLLLEQAQAIPYPVQDILFVESGAYGDGLRELISISGFYSAIPFRRARGRAAAESLAIDPGLPTLMRSTARSNLFWYAPRVDEVCPGVVCHRLRVDLPAPFVAMNPSIAREGGAYLSVIRGVNYRIQQGRYVIHDERGVVRTRNFLARLDADLGVLALREIGEAETVARCQESVIQGFEDCRLMRWGDRWHCSATARDLGSDSLARMVLLALDDRGDFIAVRPLRGYGDGLHQKNWMPIPGSVPAFVYACSPSVVLRWDEASAQVQPASTADPGYDLSHWRGGTPLIPWEEGYLALVHEARDTEAGREYVHRFVRFDARGCPIEASLAFVFLGPGIEFAAGLVEGLDPARHELIVSFGVNDREAWVARVPRAGVEAMLLPLQELGSASTPL